MAKYWLFAGYFDKNSLEGGMIGYRGTFNEAEATTYVVKNRFDWAQLVEVRFGELHIVCWFNEGEWVDND